MSRRTFGLVASIVLAGLAPSVVSAQSLGGSITNTETDRYLNGWPDLLSTATWSNWQYTDAAGTIHSFAGTTKATYKYIFYIDGSQPKLTGITYTSLTNVQATDGSIYYLTAEGAKASVNGYGTLHPKYQVVSVVYAPPGTGATVDYSTSTGAGTTTDVSREFSQGINFSVKVGGSFFNLLKDTTTYSGGWTESTTHSNSMTVNKTSTLDLNVAGQESPAPPYGIDHDYDQIYICLNPVLGFSASASNSSVSGATPNWTLACDNRDTNAGTEPDIISLTVAQLKNPALITNPDLLNRLARVWAGPNEGLTTTDFANILARDPFFNDGTNGTRPVSDASKTNNRFQQVGSVSYQPLYPGQGPQSETGSFSYETTNTQSKDSVDTYTVSSESDADVSFWIVIGINSSSNYTWTNTVSESVNTSSGQTTSYSIPRPPSTWTGKTQINVYQDTVYGTFFFAY